MTGAKKPNNTAEVISLAGVIFPAPPSKRGVARFPVFTKNCPTNGGQVRLLEFLAPRPKLVASLNEVKLSSEDFEISLFTCLNPPLAAKIAGIKSASSQGWGIKVTEFSKYSGARLDDRHISELVGIARGVLADGQLVDAEVALLYNWLVVNEGMTRNPVVRLLYERVSEILADQIVTEDEREELVELLGKFNGEGSEVGEFLKPTNLPFDDPAPEISIPGNRFCFTGTFTLGTRKVCDAAVLQQGGTSGSLVLDTNFLVVGEYVTDDWMHSSFGRKIEKACGWREDGVPIRIVSEQHWRDFLE